MQQQKAGDYRMYDIEFNGKSGRDFCVIPARRPSVPAPILRVTETEIPGMDGTLTEIDGTYGNIVIPVEFNFLVQSNKWMDAFRKAKKWLTGSGKLILGDDQSFFYKVIYCNITDTERTSRRLGNFTAEFTCYPYAFLIDGQREFDPEDAMYNPYMLSKPIYKIAGSGSCNLVINGNTMKVTVNQEITIDSEKMIAYNQEMVNQSNLLSGDYEELYLLEGANTINISEGFSLSVIPNWRTL